MRAALYNLAFEHHAYLVGMANGAQAMGNGDGGARLHQALQGLLYQALALGVECRGGFVENEYRGILQYGAGDAQALALTT